MLPVRTVSRPAALTGQQNGQIDPDRLTTATTTGGTATLVTAAAGPWRALAAAAEQAGHILVPFSTYRSYAKQKALFLARYKTTPKANTDVKTWNGQKWYRHTGATTAAPGTSNHGWGLAIDLRVRRPNGERPIDEPAIAWLVAHEQTYGWSHEIQSEPWHIRYFAGDNPPIEEDTLMADDVASILQAIDELRSQLHTLTDTGLGQDGQATAPTIYRRIEADYRATQSLTAAVARLSGSSPSVNVGALAAEIADALDDDLAAAVANELARRLGSG